MIKIKSRDDFGRLVEGFHKTGVGAEIGVEYGANSKKILSQWTGKLLSVDMWADANIYRDALNRLGMEERCQVIKGKSTEVAGTIENGSLDFVYIDADHDYKSCKEDLLAWFPKVRHGGIVAGHDYLNWAKTQGAQCDFGVKAAIDEFCSERGYRLHVTTDDYWQGNPYPTWYFVKEIPRIIYYTWVSPDPLPDKFKKYIDSWRVVMPDYEIRQISLDNVVKNNFTLEAIRRQKYSVAGHYGRVERLHETGGIYFDVDVEATRSFDDLLDLEFFVACETNSRVNNAVIGSAPGHFFNRLVMHFMDNLDFNNPGPLGLEIHTGPEIFTIEAYKLGWSPRNVTQKLAEGKVTVFDSSYFYPYYFDEMYRPGCIKENTHAIHHWAKTW